MSIQNWKICAEHFKVWINHWITETPVVKEELDRFFSFLIQQSILSLSLYFQTLLNNAMSRWVCSADFVLTRYWTWSSMWQLCSLSLFLSLTKNGYFLRPHKKVYIYNVVSIDLPVPLKSIKKTNVNGKQVTKYAGPPMRNECNE